MHHGDPPHVVLHHLHRRRLRDVVTGLRGFLDGLTVEAYVESTVEAVALASSAIRSEFLYLGSQCGR